MTEATSTNLLEKKKDVPATPAPPAKYLELEDQDNVYQPDMEVVYMRQRLLSPHFPEQEKVKTREKLMEKMTEKKMTYAYKQYCVENAIPVDEGLVDSWTQHETEELKMIQQAEDYSKENLGDTEVRDQLMRRANFLSEIGAFDRAIEAYNIALDKSIGVSPKLHVSLTIIRIALARKDMENVRKEIKRAKDLLEKGGDWERRNKLKIYEGMSLILGGHLEEASALLVSGLSTFSATELIAFDKFVLYGVCLAIIAESRQNYKSNVMESPEVHQVNAEDKVLEVFTSSFYQGDYKEGFGALMDVASRLKHDFYFSGHVNKYLLKLRIRCYKSFLQPFRNVKISTMAHRFGVPEAFIEAEVSTFISSGHLASRIDRVEGIIYAYTESEVLADKIIEEGEVLQTKIQKLSRIMYM